jgi:Ca2+-binding RTX toxin-like protein
VWLLQGAEGGHLHHGHAIEQVRLESIMANFIVTNLNDSGAGSLRAALTLANANVDADTITFTMAGTITLTSELALTNDVTIIGDINGDNKADVTISGNNVTRIFHEIGATTDVNLNSLTLINGNSGAKGYGGAVWSDRGGTLNILNTTVSGNTATYGGGIATYATVTTVTNSLISNNLMTYDNYSGGGIYTRYGSLTLVNTTVDGNHSNSFGGGVGVSHAAFTAINSTITNNQSDANGTLVEMGGGIAVFGVGSSSSIINTIITGNTSGTSFTLNDVNGTVTIADHSVFGTAPTITTNIASLINVADVGLGALGNHGGTTQTRDIISPTSVLLNAGNNGAAAGLVKDANGNLRIQQGTVDIGATEFNVLTVINTNDSGVGSLRAAIDLANASAGLDHIVFQTGLSGSINLLSGLAISYDLTIDGDTNGDGDSDITLTNGGNDVLLTNLYNVNTTLSSLTISGVTQNYGASAIANSGNLTINYSVFSNNSVLGIGGQNGNDGGTIVNLGSLILNQSVFSNNSAVGQAGAIGSTPILPNAGNGGPGSYGGSASASVLNFGSLTLGVDAIINGIATGGAGGKGGNGVVIGSGGTGGTGGSAALGILNAGGTAVGTGIISNQILGGATVLGGAGGLGGTGATLADGAAGSNGLSSLLNLSLANGMGNFTAQLMGTEAANTITGVLSGQKFFGLGGADNITGNDGSILFGGAGADTLTTQASAEVHGGLGNDMIRTTFLGGHSNGASGGIWDGGQGNDTFDGSLSSSGLALQLNLSTGGNNFSGTIISIENVIGTSFADTITGDAGDNTLQGLAGIDSLSGGAGNDTLIGGVGADVLDGGADTDTAYYYSSNAGVTIVLSNGAATGVGGEAAGDTLIGIENIIGSDGFGDTLIGDADTNYLSGAGGDDFLDGGAGADSLIGGAGTDTAYYYSSVAGVTVNLANGAASGGDAQADYLNGIEQVIGSNTGGDTLTGDSGTNYLAGFGGNDTIDGGAAFDSLSGGAGTDTVSYASATSGVTVIMDYYAANSGVSWDGSSGDLILDFENIFGSAQNDILLGDAGANVISGGSGGDDTLYGKGGADQFRFDTTHFGYDVIADFVDGVDKLSFSLNVAHAITDFTIYGNGTTLMSVVYSDGSIAVVQGVAPITLDASDFLFM